MTIKIDDIGVSIQLFYQYTVTPVLIANPVQMLENLSLKGETAHSTLHISHKLEKKKKKNAPPIYDCKRKQQMYIKK